MQLKDTWWLRLCPQYYLQPGASLWEILNYWLHPFWLVVFYMYLYATWISLIKIRIIVLVATPWYTRRPLFPINSFNKKTFNNFIECWKLQQLNPINSCSKLESKANGLNIQNELSKPEQHEDAIVPQCSTSSDIKKRRKNMDWLNKTIGTRKKNTRYTVLNQRGKTFKKTKQGYI